MRRELLRRSRLRLILRRRGGGRGGGGVLGLFAVAVGPGVKLQGGDVTAVLVWQWLVAVRGQLAGREGVLVGDEVRRVGSVVRFLFVERPHVFPGDCRSPLRARARLPVAPG